MNQPFRALQKRRQAKLYPQMNKILIISLLINSALSIDATAQVRFSSLEEVWRYADEHSIQIQAATASKASAAINLKEAKATLLPVVSANGAFTDNVRIQSTLIPAELFNPAAPPGTYTEATFGRRYIYNGSVNAQLDLINTKDWFAVKAARLGNEIAALNIAATKLTLYQQLANSYYTYLLMDEAEQLLKENLVTATNAFDIASNKFKEGIVGEPTFNTALINQKKAEKDLASATESKNIQLNTLRSILNTTDSIQLTEQLSIAGATTAQEFAKNPAVELAGLQALAAKNEWRSSKAAYAPTLSAVYQYNTQIAGDDFLQFHNTNSLPQQYWGLRLSVPIFNGGSKKYAVQKANIDLIQTQKEYENMRLQSDLSDQNLRIAYKTAVNTYRSAKEILSLYQQNDLHAQRKMNEGLISLDDRLKIYSDMLINQNEYLQAMSEYLVQQYLLQIRQTNFTK